MLIKKQVLGTEILVPSDMNDDLLEFIIRDAGKSRFIIGIYIPESVGYKFVYDTCHISVWENELRVHSQRNSRSYQLYMYAWEHVYCLMPSAKAKRKAGSGWVDIDVGRTLQKDPLPSAWHSAAVTRFVEAACNAAT